MIVKCVQCQKEFELSGAEIAYYEEQEIAIPKCCRACRQANRIKQDRAVAPRVMQRGKSRKKVLKAVPTTVLVMLVALSFVYISFVRGNSGSDDANARKEPATATEIPSNVQTAILFRNEKLLTEHYNKHGISMGYESEEEYLAGANAAINAATALRKKEKEDGDDVYYVEETNDLVIVSTDGYIRTYFRPEDGISYFERQ